VGAGFPKNMLSGFDPRDHAPAKIQSAMTNQHKAVALQVRPLRSSQKIFADDAPVENRATMQPGGPTRQFRGEFHGFPPL